jgi:hypothetical protein
MALRETTIKKNGRIVENNKELEWYAEDETKEKRKQMRNKTKLSLHGLQ